MDINEIIKQVTQEVCASIGTPAAAAPAAGGMSPASLAKYIDHTLLKPQATTDDIRRICDEAKKYQFASVCVNPSQVKLVAELLQGSGVTPCCVIAFPFGATPPESKANETFDAINNGAREVDMVINIGAVKSGDWMLVKRDIEAVVGAAKGRALVKVIIEACLLTDEEKVKACTVSKLAGADYVKTSTGYSTGGATVEDIRLMRQTVGPDMGVKASGGIKTYQDCVDMINAGASRVGASASVEIVSGGGVSCVNCGACKQTCPTGHANLVKQCY